LIDKDLDTLAERGLGCPPVADPSDIPVLLRAARGSYANTIAARLAADGFDDLPRNGPFVLGGMANQGGSAVGLIRGLGVSRQAASQLIDTLVLRGYLTREVNPEDRRRMDVELTARGRAAATSVRAAILEVDRELNAKLSAAQMTGLRAGLAALAEIKERTGRGGQAPEF
jgi:DNA-binding MarR family transcriptional regulator